MRIEIYGIPEELHRCYGCISAFNFLKEKGIEYVFYPVLLKSGNDLGFEYDRKRIEELKKRTNNRNLSFQYPRIFIDGDLIGGYRQLKEKLGDG